MKSSRSSSVLLHGEGRSGTSWLQKIFDHHPQTFSIFEPEVFYKHPAPWGAERIDADILRQYLENMEGNNFLRAMRKRPLVQKPYRSKPLHYIRLLMMGALSGVQSLSPNRLKGIDAFPIPDFCDRNRTMRVIKCVSHQNALPLLANICEDTKFIYIIRHPCGKVLSTINGIDSGKMPLHYPLPQAETDQILGQSSALDHLSRTRSHQVEILAYRWAVINGLIYEAARSKQNIKILKYEDLCTDPIQASKALFDWVGLEWDVQTDAFLQNSINAVDDGTHYHDVLRNPLVAANKWRSSMDKSDINTVLKICNKSAAFEIFEGDYQVSHP